MTNFNQYHERVTKSLETLIPKDGDSKLNQAMRYAMLNGGKRLRPTLVYIAGKMLGEPLENLDLIAAAVECIHCYSLVHDDLPSMDNDDLRRGKPTCHIAFDEATAILAGDALQSLAFEFLAKSNLNSDIKVKMISILAKAAGHEGMVKGQALDLNAEGQVVSKDVIENIHSLKTGALIKASLLLGAIAANCADSNILKKLENFGDILGLMFQIQDDLLDATGKSDITGKLSGQDAKHNKATYTTQLGIEKALQRIHCLTEEAIKTLNQIPHDTEELENLCYLLTDRIK